VRRHYDFVNKGMVHHSVKDSLAEIISLIFEPKPGLSISLIAAYRPPHPSNEESFFSRLEALALENENSHETIIIGDLNYNLLEGKNNKLTNFMINHGFQNTVNKGTRLSFRTWVTTLLDVILCYCFNFFITSEVFFCPFSDHFLVASVFNFKSNEATLEKVLTRRLNDERLDAIRSSLRNILRSFSVNPDMLGVNIYWGILKNIIISCIDQHALFKQMLVIVKSDKKKGVR
jgi:hypothetical protein